MNKKVFICIFFHIIASITIAQKLKFDTETSISDADTKEDLSKVETLFNKTILNNTNSTMFFLDSHWNYSDTNNYAYIRLIAIKENKQGYYRYEDYYKSKGIKNIGYIANRDTVNQEAFLKDRKFESIYFRESGIIHKYVRYDDTGKIERIKHFNKKGKELSEEQYQKQNHAVYWNPNTFLPPYWYKNSEWWWRALCNKFIEKMPPKENRKYRGKIFRGMIKVRFDKEGHIIEIEDLEPNDISPFFIKYFKKQESNFIPARSDGGKVEYRVKRPYTIGLE